MKLKFEMKDGELRMIAEDDMERADLAEFYDRVANKGHQVRLVEEPKQPKELRMSRAEKLAALEREVEKRMRQAS